MASELLEYLLGVARTFPNDDAEVIITYDDGAVMRETEAADYGYFMRDGKWVLEISTTEIWRDPAGRKR
jgi:hypothetical protein